MITRKEYMGQDMSGTDREWTHREYYAQFVDAGAKERLADWLPRLLKSTDEHLNDIPLHVWDDLGPPPESHAMFKECGDNPTMAGYVCIWKEAARQLMEESRA